MQVPAFVFHDDFFQYSPSIIGDEAARLGKIVDPYIPVAPTVCITKETLLEIAQFNHLDTFLIQYINSHSTQSLTQTQRADLGHRFMQQIIPEQLATTLLAWHDMHCDNEFARVFASHTSGTQSDLQREHVSGNTNTLQSILEVWWEALQPLLQVKRRLSSPLDLIPTAICIQKESVTHYSGVAYSLHPRTGVKTEILIESVRGFYQPSLSSSADTYEVDSFSNRMVSTQTGEQIEILAQIPDGIESRSFTTKNSDLLPERYVLQLATLTRKIKQKFIHHVVVYWCISDSGLEVTNVEPYYFDHHVLQRKTETQIIVTAGNPNKAHEYTSIEADGVFFKSDYLFMAQGMHPQHLLKSEHKKNTLEKDFLRTLYTLHKTHKKIWYRPLQLDSETLRSLPFSEIYEPEESNPSLGFTGALKALHMPEVFDFELSMLKKVATQIGKQFQLSLPPVRNGKECTDLVSKVRHELTENEVSLWLPLHIPSQLLSFEIYNKSEITGYYLDLESLHALFYGYDPDNLEVAGHYKQNNDIFETLIPQVVTTILENEKQVYIQMKSFSRLQLELALQAHVSGVIIKPKNAMFAKECVLEFEKSNLRRY